MAVLKVEMVSTDSLVPYINNAKVHEDRQIDMIAGSIQEFGFTNPILTDGAKGIIAGHGRLMAAKKLGMEEVPTIELGHLGELEKKAYILADNRLAEVNTSWDLNLLSNELKSLEAEGFDIELTGFDDSFFVDDEAEGETDEDSVPDLPETPVAQPGDIWILGRHRLACIDCMDSTQMDALMAGVKADMVFTDPPYGVSYQSNSREKSAKFEVLKNDEKILDICPTLEIYSTGWVFVWTSWKVLDKWVENMRPMGYPSNMVVWSKGGGGIGDLKKTFATDYEVALVFNRGAELVGKRIGSVWSIKKDNGIEYKHPTQKPVALASEAIDKTTKPRATVLDIFSGSGSTIIACEKTGRSRLASDIAPEYVDVGVTRWQEFTGQTAYLESSGESFNDLKQSGR